MKLKLAKYFCLFLILYFTASNSAVLAQEADFQFNFDDEYQGEDSAGVNNAVYDPFEKVNRKIFVFNEVLDKKIAAPIVRQYAKYVPKIIRDSIHNFTNNLSTPFSVLNSMLQGDGKNAMASFSSFLINTTIGVGGIFDVAKNKEIKFNEEDLGQTFGKHGIGSGPYLVIPFLGPSDVRDFSGFATKQLINPLAFNVFEVGGNRDLIDGDMALYLSAANMIDTREGLIGVIDDIRKDSFDVYATMRSAFLQRREALIQNK